MCTALWKFYNEKQLFKLIAPTIDTIDTIDNTARFALLALNCPQLGKAFYATA